MRSNHSVTIDRGIVAGQRVKEREYWLNRLSGELQKTIFPCDYHRRESETPGKETVSARQNNSQMTFSLSSTVSTALGEVSGGSDIRLHIIFMAAVVVLLHKYTGSCDILTGAPIYKQEKADGEVFINTVLVLRHGLKPGELSFKQLLVQVGETVREAVEHQNYPLETLLSKLELTDRTEGFPFFDIAVLLENIHERRHLEPFPTNMMVICRRKESNIEVCWEFNPCLYRYDTVTRLTGHFQRVLEAGLSQPGLPIAEIDILSAAEKQKLLFDWNDTCQYYPLEQTIVHLFCFQALALSDHLAMVAISRDHDQPDIAITYKELNEKSDQLAVALRSRGVEAESIVAIMMERTVAMIIAILAVLKAGGAYLPISPGYPVSRQCFMLEDSRARVLLTEEHLIKERVQVQEAGWVEHILYANDPGFYRSNSEELTESPGPNNLAYVIYTSGTTGHPKGVMIEHRSLVNLLYSLYWELGGDMGPGDRCLGVTSISFDISVCEIFLPLAFGAGLVLLPAEKRFQLSALARVIIRELITFAYIPPALLSGVYEHLRAYTQGGASCLPLEKLIVGAEPVFDGVLEPYGRLNPLIRIINGYGPTETTIFSTTFSYLLGTGKGERIPIGRPVGNTQVYIVDAETDSQLRPPGVPGELIIGGNGLARGYLNRPELTFQKFFTLDRGFARGKKSYKTSRYSRGYTSTRFYKTGDLAYYDNDGYLHFLGRMDRQVKIRGYRIEQGEIEQHLLRHPGIKDAVVIDLDDGEGGKYLCAYYVQVTGTALTSQPVTPALLREYLLRFLPRYMVPDYFMMVEAIPLTINGKVDRRGLPLPRAVTRDNYVEPRSPIEKKLAHIWRDILKIERVGIHDNFFDMGGNSLGIVQLISRIKEELGCEIPEIKILEHPTIGTIAGYLGGNEPGRSPRGEPGENRQRGIDRSKLSVRNKRMRGGRAWVREI